MSIKKKAAKSKIKNRGNLEKSKSKKSGIVDVKTARKELKEAITQCNAALSTTKTAALSFVKSQGKNSPERKELLFDVKETMREIKELLHDLKASELKLSTSDL